MPNAKQDEEKKKGKNGLFRRKSNLVDKNFPGIHFHRRIAAGESTVAKARVARVRASAPCLYLLAVTAAAAGATAGQVRARTFASLCVRFFRHPLIMFFLRLILLLFLRYSGDTDACSFD